jgi:hypothetical protein
MFGWLPEVDLHRVKDDLQNRKSGFSFVCHPDNHLSEAYLSLSMKACTAELNGLMTHGTWNRPAVMQYLGKKETFLIALLATMYITGGQAPRGSEIFSIDHCNGAFTERGVYVYDGFMAYLTRYHKARATTNYEFYVMRYLPIEAGKLLFYYLVYIRPFSEMLAREIGLVSGDIWSNHLFCSNQDPTKVWGSGTLTKVLREISADVFHKPIGIRLYRQLSIAITNKHVQWIANPFKRHDDKSATANSNVIFAWQSCHRPAQRAEHYALDGAFPTHLQPVLLTMYRRASTEWHRYHGHKSRDSPPSAKYQGPIVQATQPTDAKEVQEKAISRGPPHFTFKNRRVVNDHEESVQRPSKRRQADDYQYSM